MSALTLLLDELGEWDGLPLPLPPSRPAALLRLFVRLELLDWRLRLPLPLLLLPCPALAPLAPAPPLLLLAPAEPARSDPAFAPELLLLPSLSLLARSWCQPVVADVNCRCIVVALGRRGIHPMCRAACEPGSRPTPGRAGKGAEGSETRKREAFSI